MSGEPTAVTKTREWVLIAKFLVPATPDPAYDVEECERMADRLGRQIAGVLTSIDAVDAVTVETLDPNEP